MNKKNHNMKINYKNKLHVCWIIKNILKKSKFKTYFLHMILNNCHVKQYIIDIKIQFSSFNYLMK